MAYIDTVMSNLGQAVQVFAPNFGSPNVTGGINAPAWTRTGTDVTVVLEELSATDESFAGGPMAGKTGRLFTTEADGALLQLQDLVVDAQGNAWRIVGEPVHYGAPLPHYEILLEWVGNPPVEVLV